MKHIMILFAFFLVITSQSYSQWQYENSIEFLNTYETEFKDFVISEDKQFIYTIGDDNVFKKWDYKIGILLKTDTIPINPNYSKPENWIFLSSDAKTLITGYYLIKNQINERDDDSCLVYIWDIEELTIVDTLCYYISLPFSYSKLVYYFNKIDYSSSKQILLASIYETFFAQPPVAGATNGGFYIFQKQNDYFHLLDEYNGTNEITITDDNLSAYFINPYHASWSQFGGSSSSGSNQEFEFIYLLDSTQNITLSSFSKKNNEAEGTKWDYHSGFFTEDLSKLYLSEKNTIHVFDLLDTSKSYVYQLKDLQSSYRDILLNSINERLFSALSGNKLSLFLKNEIFWSREFILESVNHPTKTIFNDDFFILSENNLFRIKYDTLFSLYANFQLNDSIYIQQDEVQFYNCSLGNPDSVLWDFGDGSISTEFNPTHSYTDTGYFDIKLTVWKDDKSESITKTNSLYVMPYLNADFNYETESYYPVGVSFKNLSEGSIDSVLWEFGDGETSNSINPTHSYYLSGEYEVNLTIFSSTKLDALTKTITINTFEPELKDIEYEQTISDKKNFTAFKGFESSNNDILYKISNSDSVNVSLVGNKSYNNSWENQYLGSRTDLFELNDGNFVFIQDSIFSLMNSSGDILLQNKHLGSYNEYSLRSNGKDIFATYNNPYYKMAVINENFEIDTTFTLADPSFGRAEQPGFYGKNLIAFLNDTTVDFALSCDVTNIHDGQEYRFSYLSVNNYYEPIDVELNDFIRLNDSIFVAVFDNEIALIENTNLLSSYSKLESGYFNSRKLEIVDFKINHLIRVNDSLFVASGKKDNFPAYILLNDKGEIINERIIEERIGEFYFCSLTRDRELLFSGQKSVGNKTTLPYFLKVNDKNINDLEVLERYNIIKNINLSPNPFSDYTTLNFVTLKTSRLKLKVFNQLGVEVLHKPFDTFLAGQNQIKFDLKEQSNGIYYIVLESENESHSEKLIYLR